MTKKNFKLHDKVCIIDTGSSLDGTCGLIYGSGVRQVLDFYIVAFEAPLIKNGEVFQAILLPESNLELVKE